MLQSMGSQRIRHDWAHELNWTQCLTGFPGSSSGKGSLCSEGDLGSIPGLGRSPRGGDRNSFQYSCLEDPHEQRSLEGYSVWGRKESDMTEHLSPAQYIIQQAKLIDIGGCYIPKNSSYWWNTGQKYSTHKSARIPDRWINIFCAFVVRLTTCIIPFLPLTSPQEILKPWLWNYSKRKKMGAQWAVS